jgi:hypothetical protein
MRIYYKIWVDIIYLIKKDPIQASAWKAYSKIAMMLLMSFNIGAIIVVLRVVGVNIIITGFSIIPLGRLNNLLTSFYVFLPVFILNHLLIFYRDRYKKLLIKYPDQKGKLGLKYLIFTVISFLGSFTIHAINQ